MKDKVYSLIVSCVILVLGGCAKDSKRPSEHIPQASDTLYTAQAAMLTYGTDPERALILIDSALIVGNVDAYTADFLRAKVYAHSPDNPRLDEAITLCEDLLQRDSTRAISASSADRRSNILQLLMDTARMRKDYELWLKYAIEMVDLSRKWSSETEALRMEAEVGLVLTYLGRHDEGLAKLDQVIRTLEAGPLSVDRMDAGIIARKRKITVLEEDGSFEAVIPEGMAIIKQLEKYEKQPSAYAEDSFRLPPIGEDRARYCRYYKSQAWAFIARAYARTSPPHLAEARKYVRLLEQSDYGQTFGGRAMIAPAWKALGEWDKLLSFDAEVESRLGADTLNADYALILKDRADAAAARGQHRQAVEYMNRYTALQNELSRQLMESEAQEYAARYHAAEQDRKIEEAENEAARKDTVIKVKNTIIVAVVVLLVLAVGFIYFAFRQRRTISEKNRALVRMIDEQTKAQEASQSSTPAPDPALFKTIDRTIREERLYKNPNLQRQDILERFDISRRTLNDLLAAYSGGQSLTSYINAMRLQDAVLLLKEEPEMSLTDIAESVGFTPATLRDQFKRQFGMTPTEYRQNL